MWQRFTEELRRAVFFAQEEAILLRCEFVMPEHLLLGLLRIEDCVACKMLISMGVSTNELAVFIRSGDTTVGGKGANELVLSAESRELINITYDQAKQLGNSTIGTEHLLLGLIVQNREPAGEAFAAAGVTLAAAQRAAESLRKRAQSPDSSQSDLDKGTKPEPSDQDGLWPRFTSMSRQSIFHSQEEATVTGVTKVSVEHLLLGVLKVEKCLGVLLLNQLGIETEVLRKMVHDRICTDSLESTDEMVLTPTAKFVIDCTKSEAAESAAEKISTKYLILGILRAGDSIAFEVLESLGVTLESARTIAKTLLPLSDGSD